MSLITMNGKIELYTTKSGKIAVCVDDGGLEPTQVAVVDRMAEALDIANSLQDRKRRDAALVLVDPTNWPADECAQLGRD